MSNSAVEMLDINLKQSISKYEEVLKECFESHNCEKAVKFFNDNRYNLNEISAHSYKKLLKSLEMCILKDTNPHHYIEGLITLKNCNKDIKVRASYKAVIFNFLKCCYAMEDCRLGYNLWLAEALKRGALTKFEVKRAKSEKYFQKVRKDANNEVIIC